MELPAVLLAVCLLIHIQSVMPSTSVSNTASSLSSSSSIAQEPSTGIPANPPVSSSQTSIPGGVSPSSSSDIIAGGQTTKLSAGQSTSSIENVQGSNSVETGESSSDIITSTEKSGSSTNAQASSTSSNALEQSSDSFNNIQSSSSSSTFKMQASSSTSGNIEMSKSTTDPSTTVTVPGASISPSPTTPMSSTIGQIICYDSTCAGSGCVESLSEKNGTCRSTTACKIHEDSTNKTAVYTLSCSKTKCDFLEISKMAKENCCLTSLCNNNMELLKTSSSSTRITNTLWFLFASVVVAMFFH